MNEDDDQPSGTRAPLWKTYGTTRGQLARYGLTDAMLLCPSAHRPLTYLTNDPIWGSVVWTNYIFMSGLNLNNNYVFQASWGTAAPAVRSSELQAADHYLAADEVVWSGGSSYQFDTVFHYRINHPDRQGRPAAQNILYGDGHVDTKNSAYYGSALTTVNASFYYPGGGFFYWAPAESQRFPSPPYTGTHTTPPASPIIVTSN